MNVKDSREKRIDYDPIWLNPLQKERSSTDIYCLYLLVIFIFVWLIIVCFAFSNSNLENLQPPTDSEGRRCGIDIDVLERPYLFIFDMSKCNNGTCSTTQLCISECPNTNFLFEENIGDIALVKSKLICKLGVDIQSINSWNILSKYVAEEKCAKFYLESLPKFQLCKPTRIPDKFKDQVSNETIPAIRNLAAQQAAKNSASMGIINEFSNAKYKIILFIILSGILATLYLLAMSQFTTFVVYLTIFSFCALIFYTVCQAALIYSFNNTRTDALAGLIFCVILLIIIILFTIFLWRKINIVCKVMKEACKTVLFSPTILLFSLLIFFIYVIVIIFSTVVLLHLNTVTGETFKVKMLDDGCSCPRNLHYTDGELCDPKIFIDLCKTKNNDTCVESGCRFFKFITPWSVIFMQGINGFGFLWLMSFISDFNSIVLTGTFATWYWTYNKQFMPKFGLYDFAKITVRYHLGSLALGSLVIPIGQTINRITKRIKSNSCSNNNWAERFSRTVDVLESIFKFFTRYIYVMIAVHGQPFFTSARNSFNLLTRNLLRVLIVNDITDWLLYFGIFLITGLTTIFAWSIYGPEINEINNESENYTFLICTAFGSFLLISTIIQVLRIAIDTIFICFLEDLEYNDGSVNKPYFATFRLRELFRK